MAVTVFGTACRTARSVLLHMVIHHSSGAGHRRVQLIVLLAALTALPACARTHSTLPAQPPRTPGGTPGSPHIVRPAPAYLLEPDFRRLGEALATFWRAEGRFPADAEELRAFAEEHELDLRLTQITDLSFRSKLYGKVLMGGCGFPYPAPAGGVLHSTATFELDATDSEGVKVSFQAGTPDGQTYLDEAFRVFNDRFTAQR